MSTKFLSPGWRMPRNANQSKSANYSLDFNGTGDKINLGNIFPTDSDMSVSVWFKYTGTVSTNDMIIGARPTDNDRNYLTLQNQGTNSRRLDAVIRRNGQSAIEAQKEDILPDVWHHAVYTISISGSTKTLKLYVNGNLEATSSGTLGDTPAGTVYIGWMEQRDAYGGPMKVAEASIFDYALSASQVTTLWGGGTAVSNPMALPSTPIAYYPLGTSAWDGNFLAENNAIGDYVFEIGSTPKSINSGTITDLNSDMAELSVSIWLKKTGSTSPGDYAILGKAGANDPTSFGLYWKRDAYATQGINTAFKINNGSVQAVGGQSNTGNEVAITMEDNKWYHIVGTYDGTTQSLYINGNLHDYKSTSGNITGVSDNFILGKGIYYFYNWLGELSNCMIWTKGLSQSEVTTLYNYGSPIKTLSSIPQNSDLKVWYKLDASEIYNSTSTEWSIDNNATPTAFKSSLSFDGSGNYIQTSSHPIDFTTGNFTCSAWINVADVSNHQGIFGIRVNGVQAAALQFYVRAGSPNNNKLASWNGTNNVYSTSALTNNVWNHVVLVQNGGNKEFYINGVLDNTVAQGNGTTSTATFKIGYTGEGNEYLNGFISNAQIFNTALSATEIETLYNNGTPLTSMSGYSSLQGWWKLDNTTTGIQDSVGSNNGTNNGATEYAGFVSTLAGESSVMSQSNLVQSDLQTVAPYSKYAMNFDGTNDYIQVGTTDVFSLTDMTISFWFKATLSSSSTQWIWQKSQSATNNNFGVYVWTSGSTNYVTLWDDIDNRQSAPFLAEISSNQWYNVVVTMESLLCKMYLNGSSVPVYSGRSATSSDNFASITAPFRIGTIDGSGYFEGSISNGSVWNTALTQTQVTELYNEGLPSNLNSHSAYSNLVSWWQLGENSSFTSSPNKWICADEKGSNNGESQNMDVDALTNGVGTTANGTSTSMAVGALVGDAPYSTANAISSGMAVTAKGTSVP